MQTVHAGNNVLFYQYTLSWFLQPKVEDISALDALAGDFVAPAHAKKVFHKCTGACVVLLWLVNG